VVLGSVFGKEKTICRLSFAKQLCKSERSCCFICREKKHGSICICIYVLTYTHIYTCIFLQIRFTDLVDPAAVLTEMAV